MNEPYVLLDFSTLSSFWHLPRSGHPPHDSASRLVEDLGVGPMPLWIDRLARSLHGAREAGREALQAAGPPWRRFLGFSAERRRFSGGLRRRGKEGKQSGLEMG